MRRAVWLALIGVACVGCGKKREVALPDVQLSPNGPTNTISVSVPKPPTFELPYAKMWDPKGAEKARHFAKHQTEFLAPATVGALVTLAQGGPHGVGVPAALASAYPDVAKKMEGEFPDRALIDMSRSGTGAVSTRVLVFPVPKGTDDELRAQFDEFLTRVKTGVEGTGATVTDHKRGEARPTGALSEVLYDGAGNGGYVRSVVVRGYDEKDAEFARMMLGDTEKGIGKDMVPRIMAAERGPYLVVALRNERR